jgi:hypothetical protein
LVPAFWCIEAMMQQIRQDNLIVTLN